MDHFHHTKPTFVHHSPFLEESIYIFFCKESLWCVDVSTGINGVQASQTTLHASGVTGPLLFCILCNSACQLGENRWEQKSSKVINQTKVRQHMFNPRRRDPPLTLPRGGNRKIVTQLVTRSFCSGCRNTSYIWYSKRTASKLPTRLWSYF